MIADQRNPLLRIYAMLAVAVLYAPLVLLCVFSFNDSMFIAFPIRQLTLNWYEKLADNGPVGEAFVNSLKVATVVSGISTILGILGAKAVTRYRFRGRASLVTVTMLPLVIPTFILGISLLTFLIKIGLPPSLVNVAIGHVLVCSPYALATLTSRFSDFDVALEEASMDLGETPWSTFWRVTMPHIMPGVIACLLLCFLISFDEFLVAFFVAGDQPTLPIYIYTSLRFPQRLPEMLALGVCIIVGSMLLIVLAEWLRNGKKKEAKV
jgi:spermidine/putrescine transport system permease protein